MKVLVVDDDVDLLDLMTYALRREGYNVLAAVDGQQALQRWESENPDIVLLDGNLPKIDGFEVCRRIRHESKTPIIMLTARDEEEDILRGLQIGADDYMTKPFSAKQLAARMKAVMRRCQTDPYRQPASRGPRWRPGARPAVARSDQGRQAGPADAARVPHPVHAGAQRGSDHPVQPPDRVRLGLLRRGQLEPAQDAHLPHPQEAGLAPSGKRGIKAVLGVGYSLSRG